MKITSEWLNDKSACREGVKWFDKHFPEGGEVEDVYSLLIEQKQFDWANWLITNILPKDDNVKFAIFAARQVLHIFEKDYPDDQRPRLAIEAAEKYLTNHATAAGAAASEAAWAAVWADRDAAKSAAWAARAADRDAAWAAAWAARAADRDADRDAAGAAACAAARDAARSAAWAARDAAWVATMKAILKYGLTLIQEG